MANDTIASLKAELKSNLAAKGVKRMTPSRRAQNAANVEARLADTSPGGAVKDLTTGTVAERIARLTIDIGRASTSQNPTVQKLHLALKAELARIKK